ncbi:HU domain-containing protein [Spirosoma validum]|uniref:SPOR domain-containing protein n=1 Tax=Spirosoma validum TaxID=2771355 RepID=A0A927B2N1_9BACT|nr:SPOR domain-containing protein [Spirosoma validum]MBD2754475.1 SPOR domain-containing protein [Spirosoma validum]
MASVNDYLKKLLYQYDCVVVPEFGAFLTHYQPAAFSEASGLYLPPRKRVAFNEALRFDDGILANYIMLHEPVTREGAQRHISVFVDELREQVEVIGHFELDGIGTFSRNDEGKLQFDPSLRHNFFGEAYGMSALSVHLVNRPAVAETPIEAVPVIAVGPVLVRDEDVTLTPLQPARPYWRVAAAVLLVGSLGLVSYFSVVKPGQPLQSSLDPANLFRVPAALTAPAKDKETPKKIEVTHKIVPATAPETKPVVAPPTTVGPVAVTPATVATEPAVKEEAIIELEPVKRVPLAKLAPVHSDHHFTVIAGVFSRKEKAMPLVSYLHKAGYTDAYIMVQGRKSLRYKVAAIGSDDKSEVQSHIPAISKMIGSTAWIYTK